MPTFPSEALRQEILIPYTKLAEYLDKAEAQYHLKKTQQGRQEPVVRKRRRASTPPDELASEDEKRFKQAEQKADRTADKEDEDFK